MVRWRSLLWLLGLVVLAPAVAHARSVVERGSAVRVDDDGRRFVLLDQGGDSFTVLDASNGSSRSFTSPCRRAHIGSAALILICSNAYGLTQSFGVVDLLTGDIHALPLGTPGDYLDGPSPQDAPQRIGRQWLELARPDSSGRTSKSAPVYVNWHSDEFVLSGPVLSGGELARLDRATLSAYVASTCARRLTRRAGHVTVLNCNGRPARVLGRCDRRCHPGALTAAGATWFTSPRRAVAFEFAHDRRRTFDLSGSACSQTKGQFAEVLGRSLVVIRRAPSGRCVLSAGLD